MERFLKLNRIKLKMGKLFVVQINAAVYGNQKILLAKEAQDGMAVKQLKFV